VLEPDGSVRLRKPRYAAVAYVRGADVRGAVVRGAAGTLGRELSWSEMLAIACDGRAVRAASADERTHVGTGVIIRMLTGDDPRKQTRSRAVRACRARRTSAASPVTTIAEAVYVLSSPRLCALPRAQVADLPRVLVRLPGFRVENRAAVLGALDLFAATSLDFGDAPSRPVCRWRVKPLCTHMTSCWRLRGRSRDPSGWHALLYQSPRNRRGVSRRGVSRRRPWA
jgi:hypothetical protein